MTDSFARLDDKTAVVTGASSGIGRAIAIEFARAGADVVVHTRQSVADGHRVADEVAALGRGATVLQADLSATAGCRELLDAVWAARKRVDVWVNNAGVDLLTGDAPDWTFDEKLRRLLDVDVAATMLLSREAGKRMSDAGGVVLNIGWDQADRGMEGDSGELFAAAKNAVMGFTRSLAASLAPRVRVNCVAPGWIRTKWGETASDYWQDRVVRETPLGRWGEPEDVARVARFLASDTAGFITGQIWNVNGGAVR